MKDHVLTRQNYSKKVHLNQLNCPLETHISVASNPRSAVGWCPANEHFNQKIVIDPNSISGKLIAIYRDLSSAFEKLLKEYD